MKLDVDVLRYMTADEFRVLTAVEMGMRNHEMVPTELIENIAGLKGGAAHKCISSLARNKLLRHEGKVYDGYRLTYAGYDYLAIKAMKQRGSLAGVGRQIGVGKESDIFEAVTPDGTICVLKLHRLGRISFRRIKEKRDYLRHRTHASWLYMSRLSALREYAYMKCLYERGFPVPTPIDCSRHCLLMSKADGFPLCQVKQIDNPAPIFANLMELAVRLANHGLIHCDFNEFNLIISETNKITLIDFPQMVSTDHKDAKWYFDRDIQCVRTYFSKQFKFESESFPTLSADTAVHTRLDTETEASGFMKEAKQLEEDYGIENVRSRDTDNADDESQSSTQTPQKPNSSDDNDNDDDEDEFIDEELQNLTISDKASVPSKSGSESGSDESESESGSDSGLTDYQKRQLKKQEKAKNVRLVKKKDGASWDEMERRARRKKKVLAQRASYKKGAKTSAKQRLKSDTKRDIQQSGW